MDAYGAGRSLAEYTDLIAPSLLHLSFPLSVP